MLIPFFLCWGSFLNVIAYRLIHRTFAFCETRSRCPYCKKIIAWYDNIPLISWLILRAHCRQCKKPISWLYPFIEALTAISFFLLFKRIEPVYIPAYVIFFSALIITIRTDLETMLVSRYVTLWLIPLGLLLSWINLLPISLSESLIGCISGYLILFAVAEIYYRLTKKVGMGQGDIDLLAFIGSCLGFLGWWITLIIASCLGTIIGLSLVGFKRTSLVGIKIPFGPFLAVGAMTYVLFQNTLIQLYLNI